MTGFTEAEVGRPAVSLAQAAAIAREVYGISGTLKELGSQQDRNFRIDPGGGAARVLLRVANPAWSDAELDLQDRALEALAAAGIEAPERLPSLDGAIAARSADGLAVRLSTFVEGRALGESGYLAPAVMGELGALAGRVARALAGFEHPALDRAFQWDLRRAHAVATAYGRYVGDDAERLLAAGDDAAARLAVVADDLRLQAIHADLSDDNVVARRGDDTRMRPVAVIDLGDVSRGWLVGELAVGAASLLHYRPDDPLAWLPAARAFHAVVGLTDAEVRALWPLVMLRACVLWACDAQQVAIDPENTYTADNLQQNRVALDLATALPPAVAEAAIRSALDMPRGGSAGVGLAVPVGTGAARPTPVPAAGMRPLLDLGGARTIDLSIMSPAVDFGRWTEPGIEDALLDPVDGPVVARWAERRLTRADPEGGAAATCALGAEVSLAAPVTLHAPADVTVAQVTGDTLVLDAGDVQVHLHDVAASVRAGDHVPAGAPIATSTRFRVRLCTDPTIAPPAFAPPASAEAWLALCPDPSPLLGIDAAAPAGEAPEQLMARRGTVLASAQERYYEAPPRIERGWRHLLADTEGRTYVDMVNNVTVLGHGHPRMAAATARQWALLNTNSRFNYGLIAELSERLAAQAPAGLDVVLLVNSGTEAVDLALRLARTHSGREDVLAVGEAYHGWSLGTDAISTSIGDNPNAPDTRPAWVHLLDAPNAFRGRHRGADAARYAPEAVTEIERLAAAGTPPGAFIAECVYGNAGGVVLPSGYLESVYAAVRAHGGVCIADEVQVGYGRLGEHFWGCSQQGVVPDVITIAKAMGNGHPLGAVVTTRAIADSFAAEGSFFSSAGGSPVSCVAGLTVLDVLAEEELQANAARVGAGMIAGLRELAERHALIGAVHGMGLYVGVELVRSRETLEPATEEAAAICERLLELGVIAQPTGDHRNVLKVKPPLCITSAAAAAFVERVDRVLTDGW